jgi:hypothetical protein
MWFTWSSGAGRPFGFFLSEILFPRTMGMGTCRRSSDPPSPDVCAFAPAHGPRHAATPCGVSRGGKIPIEVAAPWPFTAALHDLECASPQLGPRGPSTGPRIKTFVSMCATLLTLAPTFPTLPGPCDPAAKPGFLSWGCPKIAPPSYRSRNPTPGDVLLRTPVFRPVRFLGRWCGAPRLLRDENANSHPRAARVVSHHLDGLFLLDHATVLQAAADPGVHRVSSCRETGFPAVHLLPFEAFPPPIATASRTNPGYRGLASPPRPSPAAAFTANLTFSPFSLSL